MALDLASFSAGIETTAIATRLEAKNLPSLVPPKSQMDGRQKVDTYVKLFYYPKDEIYKWIKDNFREYKKTQAMALVATSGTSEPVPEATLQNLLKKVEDLYKNQNKPNNPLT